MKFTADQISQLKDNFSKVERVDPEKHLGRFHAILSAMDSETLEQVIFAGIRFVSKLAINEKMRREA